jgi:hypothetical protein
VAEVDPVEQGIATSVVRYLDGAAYDESAAFQAVVPELAAWLGRLFERHVVEEGAWSSYWAIDDAVPSVMERIDGDTVHIAGIAWVLADSSARTSQPFNATIRLTLTRDALSAYTLRFGDVAIGLRSGPAADRVPRSWPKVEHWLFEFTRPTEAATD